MQIKTIVTGELDNNVYIVSHKNKAVIIDAAANSNLIKEHLGDNQVVGILLTHGHFDHIPYVDELTTVFKTKCYMHKSAYQKLKDPYLNCSAYFNSCVCDIEQKDCVFVEDGNNIDLLDIDIKVVHTPGHTDCGLCFVIDNNVFTGDTLFYKSHGRVDLPTSSMQSMKDSLKKLASNYKNYHFYPGHGKNDII